MMTEFQEGRTYLWIFNEGRDFETRIVTGDYDGGSVMGDDGLWYSREHVVLLTERACRFVAYCITRREECQAEIERALKQIHELERLLLEEILNDA